MPTLPEIPPVRTAQVTRFLHMNLNCASLERSRELYTTAFAMREVMFTESKDADGSLMDMPGLLDSRVSFLYDRRGARRSPSLELVQWLKPDLTVTRYERPEEIGMQSVAWSVPSLVAAREALASFGLAAGALVEAGADDVLLFTDPDGVTIELLADAPVAQPQLRHVRLTVADLGRSTRFYEALGFVLEGEVAARTWGWLVPGSAAPIEGSVMTARMVMPTDPSFAIELTQWLSPASRGVPKAGAADQGLFRMALAVEDTRAAGNALRAAGWPHVGEPKCHQLAGTPLPDLWITFLRDPDGVTVELVERPVAAYS
ncbi:MAG: VOC family protein [Actinomycetota bacterium]|nr:VOC family protein [Actinomycetota bacterium]